jgi:hypothetical protein
MRFAMFQVSLASGVPRTSGDLCFVQCRAELGAEGCRLENAIQSCRFQRCLMVGFSQPISFAARLRHRTSLSLSRRADQRPSSNSARYVGTAITILRRVNERNRLGFGELIVTITSSSFVVMHLPNTISCEAEHTTPVNIALSRLTPTYMKITIEGYKARKALRECKHGKPNTYVPNHLSWPCKSRR